MNDFPMTWCCDLLDTETQSFDPVVARLCEGAARGVITPEAFDESLAEVAMTRVLARLSAVTN
jgi:hypothetical protein